MEGQALGVAHVTPKLVPAKQEADTNDFGKFCGTVLMRMAPIGEGVRGSRSETMVACESCRPTPMTQRFISEVDDEPQDPDA